MKHILNLTICILLIIQHSSAQDSTKQSQESYFKFSTSYLTNSVYNGRKDSLILPYLTPSITYYDKSGFYIGGSLSYAMATNENRIDLFTLDAGYDFSISNQFSAGLYASKYFYNDNSNAVRSETKGNLGGSLIFDPGIVTLYTGVDLSFASKTDINIGTSVSHTFYLGDDNNQWSITPSITMNAGTQNSYQDFVRKRKFKGPNGNTIVIKSSNKFDILDYEFSVPVTYDMKKVGFFFTPTYALPQNGVYFTGPMGNVFNVEKLENNFYAEFGFYVKF
jgi:hypothetical protein